MLHQSLHLLTAVAFATNLITERKPKLSLEFGPGGSGGNDCDHDCDWFEECGDWGKPCCCSSRDVCEYYPEEITLDEDDDFLLEKAFKLPSVFRWVSEGEGDNSSGEQCLYSVWWIPDDNDFDEIELFTDLRAEDEDIYLYQLDVTTGSAHLGEWFADECNYSDCDYFKRDKCAGAN